jgi:hypothetical protein
MSNPALSGRVLDGTPGQRSPGDVALLRKSNSIAYDSLTRITVIAPPPPFWGDHRFRTKSFLTRQRDFEYVQPVRDTWNVNTFAPPEPETGYVLCRGTRQKVRRNARERSKTGTEVFVNRLLFFFSFRGEGLLILYYNIFNLKPIVFYL